MIYVVEEQQATWLFASLSEAQAFDDKRWDDHRYSVVMPFSMERHRFDPYHPSRPMGRRFVPCCPLDFGPGQKNCKRIKRKIHQWWKARYEWWIHSANY